MLGLVGLEAIAFGRPILVPDDSGLGMWLSAIYPGDPGVVRQSTLGASTEVAAAWAKALAETLDHPDCALRAAKLRLTAVQQSGGWEAAADKVVSNIKEIAACLRS